MKTVNVRELHQRTGAIVDLVAEGHVVLIIKRGKPVAELRPTELRRRSKMPDLSSLLETFPTVSADSGRFLEEDRS